MKERKPLERLTVRGHVLEERIQAEKPRTVYLWNLLFSSLRPLHDCISLLLGSPVQERKENKIFTTLPLGSLEKKKENEC